MPRRDLDTTTGRRLALCDAADELYRLKAGDAVYLRRPRYPECRLIVAEEIHQTSDGNGGSTSRICLEYRVRDAPHIPVRLEDLAFYGWSIRRADSR